MTRLLLALVWLSIEHDGRGYFWLTRAYEIDTAIIEDVRIGNGESFSTIEEAFSNFKKTGYAKEGWEWENSI